MAPFKTVGLLPRELASADPNAPPLGVQGKTWVTAQQLLAIDYHLASLAREIQGDQFSSVALSLQARSMCVRRVRFLTEPGSLCPRWATTFIRNLVGHLLSHPEHYLSCLERQLDSRHPCKGLSVSECHAAFIAAV